MARSRYGGHGAVSGETDGVPLFVEELTRMVLDTGQFAETAER